MRVYFYYSDNYIVEIDFLNLHRTTDIPHQAQSSTFDNPHRPKQEPVGDNKFYFNNKINNHYKD